MIRLKKVITSTVDRGGKGADVASRKLPFKLFFNIHLEDPRDASSTVTSWHSLPSNGLLRLIRGDATDTNLLSNDTFADLDGAVRIDLVNDVRFSLRWIPVLSNNT